MNTFRFFSRSAWNNLWRGGQRALVAVLCIAFGVMSLVGLTLVSESLDKAMILKPIERLGADLSLIRRTGLEIKDEHIDQLVNLQQNDKIEDFTLVAYTTSLVFHKAGSGMLVYVNTGMGIDPETYPLGGHVSIAEPANVGLPTLLKETGDVVVTRDLAVDHNLRIGETIILSDLEYGTPLKGLIRGILDDTPNHQGSKVYYLQSTAKALANGENPINTALITSREPSNIIGGLSDLGWFVTSSQQLAENGQQAQDLFNTLLKGAGILGLLVGGIGVANTMQVLLSRRRKEIAIWKAIGYRDGNIYALFLLEAGVLGMVGSLTGAGLGYAISRYLVILFSRTTTLLVPWSFSPFPIIAGAITGVATTLIFAMWAIASASKVEPVALLRNEAVQARQVPKIKVLGLGLVLMAAFTGVTSLVMGSVLTGIEVIAVGFVGLVCLGGGLALILRAVSRFLPTRGIALLHLVNVNLRRGGLSTVFAMIAMFAGVVAISLGTVVSQGAQRQMEDRITVTDGYNIRILAAADQDEAIRKAINGQDIERFSVTYETDLGGIYPVGSDQPLAGDSILIGLEEPGDYVIQTEQWIQHPEGVYLYGIPSDAAPAQIEVVFRDGERKPLDLAGPYDIEWSGSVLPPKQGLVAPMKFYQAIAKPDRVTYSIRARAGSVSTVCEALSAQLPDMMVINLIDYAARFTQQVRNLYVLALAMAGLALLAGMLLMANSVSLAMINRRYELGILKAIGYSGVHILTSLAVEYGLAGGVASLVALLSVQAFLMALGMMNGLAASVLILTPASIAVIVFSGIGLSLLAVVAVTWVPIKQSPTIVLNDR